MEILFKPNNLCNACYHLAIIIDETLRLGHKHYRNKSGKLLTDLEQVIQAILEDNLQL